LEKDYVKGDLHPGDLKPALAKALNKLLQPIRDHFKNDPEAREILALVRSFRVIYFEKDIEIFRLLRLKIKLKNLSNNKIFMCRDILCNN
jgi:hypothetical protein